MDKNTSQNCDETRKPRTEWEPQQSNNANNIAYVLERVATVTATLGEFSFQLV